MKRAFVLCGLLALAGCNPSPGSSTQLVLSNAQTILNDAQTVINDYGIAKGIAQVAAVAYPPLAPGLNGLALVADGYVAKLQAATSAGNVDLATIQTLIAQINSQAQAIRTMAAPKVQVVPQPALAPQAVTAPLPPTGGPSS